MQSGGPKPLWYRTTSSDYNRCATDFDAEKLIALNPMASYGLLTGVNVSFGEESPQAVIGRQRRYPTGSFLESELFAPGPAILAACRYSAPIVRVCIPHKTRTYAIANSETPPLKALCRKGLKIPYQKCEVRRFREKRPVRARKRENPGILG